MSSGFLFVRCIFLRCQFVCEDVHDVPRYRSPRSGVEVCHVHTYIPTYSTWTGRQAGRQAGSQPGAEAANANATIHKRRDAFTKTTPICPPLPLLLLLFTSFIAAPPPTPIQIRTPVRHIETSLMDKNCTDIQKPRAPAAPPYLSFRYVLLMPLAFLLFSTSSGLFLLQIECRQMGCISASGNDY